MMTDARLAEIKRDWAEVGGTAGPEVRELLAELDAYRKAVKVLAKDKVHGVADMIGREVCDDAVAYAAIKEAKGWKR